MSTARKIKAIPVAYQAGPASLVVVSTPYGDYTIDPDQRIKDFVTLRVLTALTVFVLTTSHALIGDHPTIENLEREVTDLATNKFSDLGALLDRLVPDGPLCAGTLALQNWPFAGWLVAYNPELHGHADRQLEYDPAIHALINR